MFHLPDNPEIAHVMRTGYPLGHEENDDPDKCEVCGDELDYDEVYDDCGDILCAHCLLARYKRDV